MGKRKSDLGVRDVDDPFYFEPKRNLGARRISRGPDTNQSLEDLSNYRTIELHPASEQLLASERASTSVEARSRKRIPVDAA